MLTQFMRQFFRSYIDCHRKTLLRLFLFRSLRCIYKRYDQSCSPEVRGSKPRSARLLILADSMSPEIFSSLKNFQLKIRSIRRLYNDLQF